MGAPCRRGEQVEEAAAASGPDPSLGHFVVTRGEDIWLKMVLSDGLLHADLHPGNILVHVPKARGCAWGDRCSISGVGGGRVDCFGGMSASTREQLVGWVSCGALRAWPGYGDGWLDVRSIHGAGGRDLTKNRACWEPMPWRRQSDGVRSEGVAGALLDRMCRLILITCRLDRKTDWSRRPFVSRSVAVPLGTGWDHASQARTGGRGLGDQALRRPAAEFHQASGEWARDCS